MPVKIVLPNRMKEQDVTFDACDTVLDAFVAIESRHPHIFQEVFLREADRVRPKPYITVFLDGEMVLDFGQALGTDSELLLATAFSGG